MIVYSAEALADAVRLTDWLADRGAPEAAARFRLLLTEAGAKIARNPRGWPRIGDGEIRKFLMHLGRTAYVVYYVDEAADQIIVRIWHGREGRR